MKKVVQKIVVAGIVAHNGKILIIQRGADEEVLPGMWELPSGKREHFEKTQEALVREIKEEVGIKIEPIKPVDVFEYRVDKKSETRDTTQISFLCKPVGTPKVKLSKEHQDYEWINKDELDSYFPDNDKLRTALRKAFSEI